MSVCKYIAEAFISQFTLCWEPWDLKNAFKWWTSYVYLDIANKYNI